MTTRRAAKNTVTAQPHRAASGHFDPQVDDDEDLEEEEDADKVVDDAADIHARGCTSQVGIDRMPSYSRKRLCSTEPVGTSHQKRRSEPPQGTDQEPDERIMELLIDHLELLM